MWVISVIGIPKGQRRPRVFMNRGKTIAYSPKTTWHHLVYNEALINRPKFPIEGPLWLQIEFRMPRPKSFRKNLSHSIRWHSKRPDLDNCEKLIMDCLTHAQIWKDDSQVAMKESTKKYAIQGYEPGVTISVASLEERV